MDLRHSHSSLIFTGDSRDKLLITIRRNKEIAGVCLYYRVRNVEDKHMVDSLWVSANVRCITSQKESGNLDPRGPWSFKAVITITALYLHL